MTHMPKEKRGRGVTWGLVHQRNKTYSPVYDRFDCISGLSLNVSAGAFTCTKKSIEIFNPKSKSGFQRHPVSDRL